MKILTEGDPESDAILRSMLVTDAVANPTYQMDFTKFLGTITGGSSGGPGAQSAQGAGVQGGTPGGYY
jgi:hypothetical protein